MKGIYYITLATATVKNLANAFEDGSHPAEPNGTEGTFTLEQQQNRNYTGKTGLEAMLSTYFKYNKPVPPELLHAVEINTEVNPNITDVVLKSK
jgi:hypothetical protein